MDLAPPEGKFAGHAFPQNTLFPVDPATVTSLAHAQALLAQLQGQHHALLLENQQLHAAQQALAASQARLHAAEAVAGMGSYELELSSGALHFSDGMYRLFGEEPRSFIPSLAWIDARSHPDDAARVRHLLD
jgi:hypothetical protein